VARSASRHPSGEARSVSDLGYKTCGLAIEHLLQITYGPVMTGRRRSSTGGWTPRLIEESRSRGAVASSELPFLFAAVRAAWDALADSAPPSGEAVAYSHAGRTVFPAVLVGGG
jgi:hypothetical protein